MADKISYVNENCGDVDIEIVDKLRVVGERAVIPLTVDVWDSIGCEDDSIVRYFSKTDCVYKDGLFYWSLEDMNIDTPPSAKWTEGIDKCQMLQPVEGVVITVEGDNSPYTPVTDSDDVKVSCDESDIPGNTAAIIQFIAESDSTLFSVPRCVYYDWCAVLEAMPDNVTIVDYSGYDAKAAGGIPQAYVRIVQKTADTANTNGNTHWLTSDFHSAHVNHTMRDINTSGAQGSFVSWIGDCDSPFKYATQWSLDMTGTRPFTTLNGYDNVGGAGTRQSVVIHPAEPDNAGSHGFGGIPVSGTSYQFYLAGLSNTATYNTKDMVGRYTLPAASTGNFQELWTKGNTLFRRKFTSDTGDRTIYYDSSGVVTSDVFTDIDGSYYGHKDKITPMTAASVSTQLSHGIYHNPSSASAMTLPEADPGLTYEFWVTSPNTLTISPMATDRFRNNAAGEFMSSNTEGDSVQLKCVVSGIWEIARREGTWTDQ